MVSGVPEVLDVDEPDEDVDHGDNLGKHVAKSSSLCFEGVFLLIWKVTHALLQYSNGLCI